MNKLTYQQILEEIKNQCSDVDEFATEGLGGEKVYPDAKYGTKEYFVYKNPILGIVKQIEQYGGEDQGSNWYVIYYFEDHDVYIKVTGYYQSYSGLDFYNEWDCCKQVIPQEKTITVYESVK